MLKRTDLFSDTNRDIKTIFFTIGNDSYKISVPQDAKKIIQYLEDDGSIWFAVYNRKHDGTEATLPGRIVNGRTITSVHFKE
jgi:hypothetical protein